MLVMLFPDFFQSLEYQSNLVWYQPGGKQSNKNEATQNAQNKQLTNQSGHHIPLLYAPAVHNSDQSTISCGVTR